MQFGGELDSGEQVEQDAGGQFHHGAADEAERRQGEFKGDGRGEHEKEQLAGVRRRQQERQDADTEVRQHDGQALDELSPREIDARPDGERQRRVAPTDLQLGGLARLVFGGNAVVLRASIHGLIVDGDDPVAGADAPQVGGLAGGHVRDPQFVVKMDTHDTIGAEFAAPPLAEHQQGGERGDQDHHGDAQFVGGGLAVSFHGHPVHRSDRREIFSPVRISIGVSDRYCMIKTIRDNNYLLDLCCRSQSLRPAGATGRIGLS